MDNQDQTQPGPEKPRLSAIRWIFAIVGGLIAVFCGGCSIIALGDLLISGRSSDKYISVEAVLAIGGIPFLFGVLIWWLAVKVGRN